MLNRRPIRRTRKGDFALSISSEEREVLRGLPGQLLELLDTDDPALFRLFPPAYQEDDELESEYKELMADDLRGRHVAALEVMAATVDQERLDEEQVTAWLTALNQLRLVLGTRLDITEEHDGSDVDADDPRQPGYALYHYLTYLQDEVVTALSG